MKNLRVFLKDKKFLIYFLLIPLILLLCVNFYANKKFEKEMKEVKVGLILDEGMQKDKNILQSFISIAQNASYKNISFVKYEKLENEKEAEEALKSNKVDMYISVKDRDLNSINKNIEAYSAGDKKVLTEEELGEPLEINIKMGKIDRNNLIIKEYMESVMRSANMQRDMISKYSQEEMLKKIESNRYKRIVMAGMPYQFLLDIKDKTPSMKLGNYIEDKYLESIEKFLKENTKDVKKIQERMKEYQKYQYKGAKEESLKQNIPTDEQIEMREKQAESMNHKSMNVATAETTDKPLDLKEKAENKKEENNENKENKEKQNIKEQEELLKNRNEEEEKNKQRKEAADRIQKERADKEEQILREVFFKLDNGNKLYLLTGTFAFLIFIQGILNIRFFKRRDEIVPLDESVFRNVKKTKIFRMHFRDFFVAFFMNVLFTALCYFLINTVFKIHLGVMYITDGKFVFSKMGEYFKLNIPKYFENFSEIATIVLSLVYVLFITKISYLVYILTYKIRNIKVEKESKKEEIKRYKKINIIYSVIGLIFTIFAFNPMITNALSVYLTRINPIYLYLNGMYMLRYNGNNSYTFANIIVLVAFNIILSIICFIAANVKINKMKKEMKNIK